MNHALYQAMRFIVLILLTGYMSPGQAAAELLEEDWKQQYADLKGKLSGQMSLAKTGNSSTIPASQAYDPHALIQDDDITPLDVALRRTRALLEHIKTLPGAKNLGSLEKELEKIASQPVMLAKTASTGAQDSAAFMALAKVTRAAALSNPLLDFDDLLFVEWANLESDPGVRSAERNGDSEYDGSHMCDQYYGHNGHANGRLYILKDFKTDNPQLKDLADGLRVPSGSNEGQLMNEGCFFTPDLSWDGKTVLFAWSSGNGWKKKWVKENRYHLFKINIDGTGLTRLTDGDDDDFDPVWLPNGRVVFISTRRGGLGRCHERRVPSYVLHSMKPDGSDMFAIDWHETNEYQPSVNNDGMLVYTRWDYVDREDCIAHHMWICYPDGRDPRAPHGNYPLPLTTMEGSNWPNGEYQRPYAEYHIRAIPNSHKYVATAGPHHGQSFGSLVILDTRIEDDNLMSQVKRLTPDAGFPESENDPRNGKFWIYGTAWPLSEDYFIVNYKNGIYLLDRFGNRTLIHAGTRAAYFRPMDVFPVRSRPLPPVIPTQTWQGERMKENVHNASIYVNNVYVTDEFGKLPAEYGPEPGKKKIKWMRIVQVFPKMTNVKNFPNIAPHASESLARIPLGVCPVEDDGSVYCEAPVEKEIYFQLLDEDGLAVQSMRSGTYVHPGEQLSCVGCHESKWESPPITPNPIAKRAGAPPAVLETEVDPEHIWPFNYYRTVKPVFDDKCLPCHREKGRGPDMSYRSIQNSLFGFTGDRFSSYSVAKWGGSRTVPGKFGAMYADLTKYLSEEHYNPGLSQEEMRRITLWLDLQSNELSAYYDVEKQVKGEKVWPALDIDTLNVQGVERRVVSIEEPGTETKMVPAVKTRLIRDRLVIHFPKNDTYRVTMYSTSGKRVNQFVTPITTVFGFSTASLTRGLYFLAIESDDMHNWVKICL
ncbi:MAG: hypothetical protein HQK83_14805 [Fibrobacteria bacterium]|nr:hypothetical protein [Fibrobacteria bacterium]